MPNSRPHWHLSTHPASACHRFYLVTYPRIKLSLCLFSLMRSLPSEHKSTDPVLTSVGGLKGRAASLVAQSRLELEAFGYEPKMLPLHHRAISSGFFLTFYNNYRPIFRKNPIFIIINYLQYKSRSNLKEVQLIMQQ